MQIKAIGTYSASQPLESMSITRREPGPQDVHTAAFAIPISIRRERNGPGRCIPACRAMKSLAG